MTDSMEEKFSEVRIIPLTLSMLVTCSCTAHLLDGREIYGSALWEAVKEHECVTR